MKPPASPSPPPPSKKVRDQIHRHATAAAAKAKRRASPRTEVRETAHIETIEEWLAKGNRITVIPFGIGSKPVDDPFGKFNPSVPANGPSHGPSMKPRDPYDRIDRDIYNIQ